MARNAGPCHPCGRPVEYLVCGFNLAQPWLWGHLWSKPADGRSLSLCLPNELDKYILK